MSGLSNDGWIKIEKKCRKQKKDPFQLAANSMTQQGTAETYIMDDEYMLMPITNEFRNALQRARLAKGLSRRQLAKIIGEKENTIEYYENGICSAQIRVIKKLNDTLCVELPKLQVKKAEYY